MKFKLEKTLRIVSELITYFHKIGTDDVHLDIKRLDDESQFTISGKIENLSSNELEYLDTVLNTQRQHEIEQYYWHLGGESELDCELTLIGMMIDTADINYEDNILTLKIFRKGA